MWTEEVEDVPNVVTIFSIKTPFVDVQFASGATYSFIFIELVEILG